MSSPWKSALISTIARCRCRQMIAASFKHVHRSLACATRYSLIANSASPCLTRQTWCLDSVGTSSLLSNPSSSDRDGRQSAARSEGNPCPMNRTTSGKSDRISPQSLKVASVACSSDTRTLRFKSSNVVIPGSFRSSKTPTFVPHHLPPLQSSANE